MSRVEDASRGTTDSRTLLPIQERRWSSLALKEASSLMSLAIPLFFTMVSWVAMKVTDTAVLGHIGTRYLDATALSDLWTSSSGVFIQSRVVSTFCGQSFGAGQKDIVGAWLQVAYVVLFSAMVPVWILWCLTGVVLHLFGKTEEEVSDANYYAWVLALCMPVRIGFSQLSTFLSCQKIVKPGAYIAVISMFLNLVGNLVLVLGIGIPGWSGFGFTACPWVTTAVEFIQLFIMWFYCCHVKQLHKECWPGWDWKHVIDKDADGKTRLERYFRLYLPSALAIGSDFWRVAAIGAIASSIDPVSLAVFNSSYRICWMCLTFLGAIAGAVGTNLNIYLGKGSIEDAKRAALVGTILAVLVLLVLSNFIIFAPRLMGQIFSNDPKVLDLFEESRWPFAAFVVTMNLSVTIEKIPMAAGRVKAVFYAGLAGSWLGQVPGVIICTTFWRKDLVGVYTGVAAGYALLVVLYLVIVLRLDWHAVVAEARARAELPAAPAGNDATSLQVMSEDELGTGEDSSPNTAKNSA